LFRLSARDADTGAGLGGALAGEATFVIEGAKKAVGFGHPADTNARAAALALYGSREKRLAPYSTADLRAIADALRDDPTWRAFGYGRGLD